MKLNNAEYLEICVQEICRRWRRPLGLSAGTFVALRPRWPCCPDPNQGVLVLLGTPFQRSLL